MQRVPGNVQNNKVTVDFDKIGAIDKKRTCIYKTPIHEKASLKFAIKGAKASRVELFADSTLLSVLFPEYTDDWSDEYVTPLDFFGEVKFHRGLIDVPVEVVVTTDDTAIPSIMVGISTPSKTWDDIGAEIYEEVVTTGSDSGKKSMRLLYHRTGCGFIA